MKLVCWIFGHNPIPSKIVPVFGFQPDRPAYCLRCTTELVWRYKGKMVYELGEK